MESKGKSFKDYYQDPEFRERHKKYMSEKVPCPKCFFETCRSNMTRHQRSKNCTNRLQKMKVMKEYDSVLKLEQEIVELKKKLKGKN